MEGISLKHLDCPQPANGLPPSFFLAMSKAHPPDQSQNVVGMLSMVSPRKQVHIQYNYYYIKLEDYRQQTSL